MSNAANRDELLEELRGRKRSRMLLAATIQHGAEVLKANLLNLSTTGALLDASAPPGLGTELTLSRGRLSTSGRVVWINGHRFGISFDEPIDEELLAEHITSRVPRKKVIPIR